MNKDFEARFRDKADVMRSAEIKVARWIIDNAEEATALTITQLANICSVSESTVIRMCQNLGYSGYREMRVSYAMDTAASKTAETYNSNNSVAVIKEGERLPDIIRKEFALCQKGLSDTLANLDFDVFNTVIDKLDRAKRIELYASGSLVSVAYYAATMLLSIGVPCTVRTDIVEQTHAAAMLSYGDVLIAMTNSGELGNIIKASRVAKNNGAAVIGLTCSPTSTLASLADVTLLVENTSYILQSESLKHRVNAPRLSYYPLIDCFVLGIYTKHTQRTVKNMIMIQEAHDSIL